MYAFGAARTEISEQIAQMLVSKPELTIKIIYTERFLDSAAVFIKH